MGCIQDGIWNPSVPLVTPTLHLVSQPKCNKQDSIIHPLALVSIVIVHYALQLVT